MDYFDDDGTSFHRKANTRGNNEPINQDYDASDFNDGEIEVE